MTEKKKPLLCYEFNQTTVDLVNEMAFETGGEIVGPGQPHEKYYKMLYPLIRAAVKAIAPNISGTKQAYITNRLICRAHFYHTYEKERDQ